MRFQTTSYKFRGQTLYRVIDVYNAGRIIEKGIQSEGAADKRRDELNDVQQKRTERALNAHCICGLNYEMTKGDWAKIHHDLKSVKLNGDGKLTSRTAQRYCSLHGIVWVPVILVRDLVIDDAVGEA